MSKLEQLLEGVEVKWKTLGEVSEIIRGVRITKKDLIPDAKYPVVSGGVGFMGYTNQYNREVDTITIAQYGTAGYVKWQLEKFWANDVCFSVKPNAEIIVNRYLYFYLINKQQYLYDISNRTAVPYSIERDKILKLQIPIPPLSVQKEIVRILDTFTELTTELTAELTARKKQYEYYETKLLYDNNFDMIPLSELCTVNQGLQIPINERQTEDGENRYFYITVQFLKGNDINYYIESPLQSVICNYDDILVTRTGSTGKIITGVRGCFHNNFFKVNCFENIINKRFMYCVLNSKVMFGKLLHAASGGTVPDLPHSKFYKLTIPIPPIKEQERIVSILDKFETLTTSKDEGLPKEIELRKKQYEYYRDMLLTFPKHEN